MAPDADRLTYQISVMQHFANGGKIEILFKAPDVWHHTNRPSWNWDDNEYRIMVEDPYAALKVAANDPTKEISSDGGKTWHSVHSLSGWSWIQPAPDYLIRDVPKRKVKIHMWAYIVADSLTWKRVGGVVPNYWIRVPSEDKIVEVEVDEAFIDNYNIPGKFEPV